MVDAHQDIACHCQEQGRDLLNSTGCDVPVMLTLQGWQQCNMRLICATLFTPHNFPEKERRYKLHSQWEIYQQWFEEYPQELMRIESQADLARLAHSPQVEVEGRKGYPVGLLLLMEGLDLLENPAELETWYKRGVRMASLTWNGTNRFASGCFADGKGLKDRGFVVLREFERLGMILDVSHLCDAGIADVFEQYSGPICASHSNSRQVTNHQRNLTDAQAVELANRGGVLGLNLLAPFIKQGWQPGVTLPTLEQAAAHVMRLAQLSGPQHTGIGSDLDGGLTPDNTVDAINLVGDLALLPQELVRQGWSDEAAAGFAGKNWWSFFERHLASKRQR